MNQIKKTHDENLTMRINQSQYIIQEPESNLQVSQRGTRWRGTRRRGTRWRETQRRRTRGEEYGGEEHGGEEHGREENGGKRHKRSR